MDPDFIPAGSLSEAITRMERLTGASLEGTRGEKRALLALRDALGLPIPTVETGAVLGAALARALGVPWVPQRHVERTTVTLDGVNALLAGATSAAQRGALRPVATAPADGLTGPGLEGFQPAVSKIEAVTRISALTNSGPERLGPGSKEQKSVLTNLGRGLVPGLRQEGLSKTRLAEALAGELGMPWGDQFISTGETIRLTGLNVLLAGAERAFGKVGSSYAEGLSPHDEGVALLDALRQGLVQPRERGVWDGREKTLWLRDQGTRQENQMEWAGWYFEFRGRDILNASFRPNPDPPQARFANTTFDYALNHVWDLKAHSSDQTLPDDEVQLNDEDAVRACVDAQGLGFLLLNGQAIPDTDGSFKAWHDTFKGRAAASSNSGRSRMRKAGFRPQSLEAFWIADTATLEAALLSGSLRLVPQGRQADGSPRPDKFHMRLSRARRELHVHHRLFPVAEGRLLDAVSG